MHPVINFSTPSQDIGGEGVVKIMNKPFWIFFRTFDWLVLHPCWSNYLTEIFRCVQSLSKDSTSDYNTERTVWKPYEKTFSLGDKWIF